MKKITINGVIFNDFGTNNYSDGMCLITTEDHSVTVERVLKGDFPGVYLNPSAPCTKEEFFGVYGTKEQYEKFYKNQREAQISKRRYHEIPVYIVGKEYIDAYQCGKDGVAFL